MLTARPLRKDGTDADALSGVVRAEGLWLLDDICGTAAAPAPATPDKMASPDAVAGAFFVKLATEAGRELLPPGPPLPNVKRRSNLFP